MTSSAPSSGSGKWADSWLFLREKLDEWQSHDVMALYQFLVTIMNKQALRSLLLVTLT